MNEQWRAVREFHRAFGAPVADKPTLLEAGRVRARSDWMLEEIDEFIQARCLTDQADAMIDLMYFALGTLVEMGVKPQALFDIVQAANMSKLWPDGKPHYREDGKVVKSPDWVDPAPLLLAEIERQSLPEISPL